MSSTHPSGDSGMKHHRGETPTMVGGINRSVFSFICLKLSPGVETAPPGASEGSGPGTPRPLSPPLGRGPGCNPTRGEAPSGPAAHPRSRLTECRLSWKAATKPFSRPSRVSLFRIPSFRQSKTRVTLERSAWMAAMAWEKASRFTPGLSTPSAILAGRARPLPGGP